MIVEKGVLGVAFASTGLTGVPKHMDIRSPIALVADLGPLRVWASSNPHHWLHVKDCMHTVVLNA